LVGRAAQLQLVEAATWREMAASQHRDRTEVPAPRGAILDRDGVPLAVSREVFKVETAPREIQDPEAVRELLQRTLGLSGARAAAAVDPERPWYVVPGVYEPAVQEVLGSVRGIYVTPRIRRDLPHGELALGVLGRVRDGAGRGGIEEAFDEVLRGIPGQQVVATDPEGRPVPGQVFEVEPPRAGGEVVLTLDVDLQEIADQAIRDAAERTGAAGGDLVIIDPETGEILALASVRGGRADALSALNTPYEPGSTLKPFTVAGLLRHGRATLEDSLDVGNGSWRINGRTLHDVHGEGVITLAEALRESSNVGVAKAALALTPGEQYEVLRDFGFGVPTGLPLPGESDGVLRRPEGWSAQSPQSLAIGYELSATPIQMAMAYGALANGGRLMQAQLVREVRRDRGEVERVEPRVVRHVVDATIAGKLGRVLVEAVDDGTGGRAQLETFRVAGKSGTSRMMDARGRYEPGAYFSSFAGFFPADDPQLVVFVKLERPQGEYYGGAVAAPVTRAAMEAALAARNTPLDRRALLRSVRAAPPEDGRPAPERPLGGVRFAALGAPDRPTAPEPRPGVAAGTDAGRAGAIPWPAHGVRPVPEVTGLPLRSAARQLHSLGFRVVADGTGPVRTVRPAPGSRLEPGDTVRLVAGRPEG
jgi:cell division protein FtsI (penicillin-binding protein 3)